MWQLKIHCACNLKKMTMVHILLLLLFFSWWCSTLHQHCRPTLRYNLALHPTNSPHHATLYTWWGLAPLPPKKSSCCFAHVVDGDEGRNHLVLLLHDSWLGFFSLIPIQRLWNGEGHGSLAIFLYLSHFTIVSALFFIFLILMTWSPF